MFYDNLIKLCGEKGISLTVLVTVELKMSSSNVTKWRKGVVPKSDTVQKIADYFGVTTDFLLNGPTQNETQHSQPEISLLEQAVLERGPSLPKEERDRLLSVLNSTIDAYLEATKDDNKKRR